MKKKNKYVSFVSDEHFLACIQTLHDAYERAKAKINKETFYNNKVDVIKLTFDSYFNQMSEKDLVNQEIIRQIDKSINNAIGAFHEQILGGVTGYQSGRLAGYDIKADDDTLFADIKNKHNTMNSSSAEALFQKLKHYADTHKKAKCYWVQLLAKSSFSELWSGEINGKEYSHSRVYKISGDRFYALLSGQDDALLQLYKALPIAITDYLAELESTSSKQKKTVFDEINKNRPANRSVLDQIALENYPYYEGFDKL